MFDFQICIEFSPRSILSLQSLQHILSLGIIPIDSVVLCFPQDNIACNHSCYECTRSKEPSVCHKLSSILWLLVPVCVRTPECLSYHFWRMTVKSRTIFGQSMGIEFNVITLQKISFPRPLRYIDVVKRTNTTTLNWFHAVHKTEWKNLQTGEQFSWSGDQKIGQECQTWLNEERSSKKPKLDNARQLRGTYLIDVKDIEFNKNSQNARRSWNCLRKQPRLVRSRTTSASISNDGRKSKGLS